METWQEMNDRYVAERAAMRARHKQEIATLRDEFMMQRSEALAELRDSGATQTQAAHALEMSLTSLNNYLLRNGIPWTPSRQGQPRHVQ